MNSGKDTAAKSYTAEDSVWLHERVARAPMPGPKPEQPQVLLLWRVPEDAPRVRKFVDLVDHPEGIDGVYGMDVSTVDTLASRLHANELLENQPAKAAWLVVLDRYGHQLGATPVLNESNIKLAFRMAKGERVRFPGMEDPYLNKPAPGFSTTTLDGKPFDLAQQHGKKTLLTFYCGCSNCMAVAQLLAQAQKQPEFRDVQFLAVTHMNIKQAAKFSKDSGEKFLGLAEQQKDISSLYDSITCPRVWYLKKDGTVAYYSYQGEEPHTVIDSLEQAVSKS